MRKLLVCTRKAAGEAGRTARYTYFVLVDEMDVGPFRCESYGVQVKESPSGEVAAVPHVTTSISRIDALMELLTQEAVSPAGLQSAVESWL